MQKKTTLNERWQFKLCCIAGGQWDMRGWLDDFRTFEWERAFPFPDLTIKQIKQLLALI